MFYDLLVEKEKVSSKIEEQDRFKDILNKWDEERVEIRNKVEEVASMNKAVTNKWQTTPRGGGE